MIKIRSALKFRNPYPREVRSTDSSQRYFFHIDAAERENDDCGCPCVRGVPYPYRVAISWTECININGLFGDASTLQMIIISSPCSGEINCVFLVSGFKNQESRLTKFPEPVSSDDDLPLDSGDWQESRFSRLERKSNCIALNRMNEY
ncbi:hypothetical protein MAP00_004688 [Monascus purpureus]|nr:hypothetical protein MAP00_004688 [Monascus purpureus]